jgi:hypothetical protein
LERVGKIISLTAVCLVIASTLSLSGIACAPRFEEAFFSYTLHPDFPLSKFANGDLGIIKPTYSRSYLLAAYCYLTAKPLNAEERRKYEKLWVYRLINPDVEEALNSKGEKEDNPLRKWLKMRAKVSSTTIDEIGVWRPVSKDANCFNTFENCSPESFSAANTTLSRYLTKYGAKSAYTQEWVSGQDKVFCHCGAGRYDYLAKQDQPEGPFPAPLSENTDPLLKADRDYQIASAHFYAMQYDQAEKDFLAIAQDNASPWKDMGLYLAARCLIRKGTVPDKIDMAALAEASALLNDILKDSRLTKIHLSARQLLHFIDAHTQPKERLHVLAKEILDPAQTPFLFQNLYDYTFLLDQYLSDSDGSTQGKPKSVSDTLGTDDLTDWIQTFQASEQGEARRRAFEKWHANHSLPWLIAILSNSSSGSVWEPELLCAAQAINETSPAYVTVSYYLIDSLLKSKQNDLARHRLADVLALNLPPSARNEFLRMQISLASNLRAFMKLAVQAPAGLFIDAGGELPWEPQKLLSLSDYPSCKTTCYVKEGANVLNHDLPLKTLTSAAKIDGIPIALRFDLVQASWTRAILLNREDLALAMAPLLKKLRPPIAPLVDSYTRASNPVEKRFAAMFSILKNPGMRPYVTAGAARDVDFSKIEDYGDNWWAVRELCRPEHESSEQTAKCPPFLPAADVTVATKEVETLKALGEAPNVLTKNVLQYARSHPNDPRIPEALHRCVKATRFGSTDAKTTDYSKQAFQLLHKRYGGSTWAAKTPYYY